MIHSKKYNSIELLRFIAATAVFFVHIPFIGVGDFGVDIFFIISGFVMMLSTDKSESSNYFFIKRLIRIVPAYYLFTIAIFYCFNNSRFAE
jgi:exopolysaccharide production protein ExoZ